MSSITKTNYNYEYQPPKNLKQPTRPSFFKIIMEPLRKSMGKSIGKKLGHINLNKSEKKALKINKDNFIQNAKNHAESISLSMLGKKGKSTHALDGISIHSNSEKNNKYILVFFGMGDCYEKHLDSLKKLSLDTGATVVSFNYRGINESTGQANSAKDYISDGSAFVDYLINEKGAQSENVLLYGHSLGGGVAAQVRKELKLDSPIISESSFSTFKEAVKRKKGKTTAWLFKKTGWNMNSFKALETVEENKLGIVVNRRDPLVNYTKSSLYIELKSNNKEKNLKLIKIGKNPSKDQDEKAYLQTMNQIKRAGWVKHLRHPHQLVMDQPHKRSAITIPTAIQEELDQLDNTSIEYNTKLALANELVELNKKFAKEDKKAYQGILKMIEDMLNNKDTSAVIDTNEP